MDWLQFINLVVPAFAACLDFGLLIFIRSACRELPDREQVALEQRFLRTFNRAIPVLASLSVLLILAYALRFTQNSAANHAVWGALFFFSAAVACSIWLNGSIDQEIISWNPEQLPPDWKSVQMRFTITGGLRAVAQLLGFILICGSVAVH
jgi:hypothetical protein